MDDDAAHKKSGDRANYFSKEVKMAKVILTVVVQNILLLNQHKRRLMIRLFFVFISSLVFYIMGASGQSCNYTIKKVYDYDIDDTTRCILIQTQIYANGKRIIRINYNDSGSIKDFYVYEYCDSIMLAIRGYNVHGKLQKEEIRTFDSVKNEWGPITVLIMDASWCGQSNITCKYDKCGQLIEERTLSEYDGRVLGITRYEYW